jgi:hypothetical protein
MNSGEIKAPKIPIYLLLIFVISVLGGLMEEKIFGKNLSDHYTKTHFGIPILFGYGFAALFMIILFELFSEPVSTQEFGGSTNINYIKNIFILSLFAAIIITISECIVGKIMEILNVLPRWDYRIWEGSKFMVPFCSGYNSIFTSILIFFGCFVFFSILYYLKSIS